MALYASLLAATAIAAANAKAFTHMPLDIPPFNMLYTIVHICICIRDTYTFVYGAERFTHTCPQIFAHTCA